MFLNWLSGALAGVWGFRLRRLQARGAARRGVTSPRPARTRSSATRPYTRIYKLLYYIKVTILVYTIYYVPCTMYYVLYAIYFSRPRACTSATAAPAGPRGELLVQRYLSTYVYIYIYIYSIYIYIYIHRCSSKVANNVAMYNDP